jgi:hypothetical protein
MCRAHRAHHACGIGASARWLRAVIDGRFELEGEATFEVQA